MLYFLPEEHLPDLDIIFVTSYDPFGLNRMVYTVKNRCIEEPDMPYEDGAENIFLYCEGESDDAPEGLRELLRYFVASRQENAVSDDLKRLHAMVDRVRQDAEVTKTAMWNKYVQKMHDDDLIRVTREAALEEGREEGREEGIEIGEARGIDRITDIFNTFKAEGRDEDAERLMTDASFREQVLASLNYAVIP